MTREEIRDFYERQVAFYTREIETSSDMIKLINDNLKMSRKSDRELVERIWNRGVVTERDMEIFNKDFQGRDTKYYLKDREYWYRDRARSRKNLAKYQKKLQEYS